MELPSLGAVAGGAQELWEVLPLPGSIDSALEVSDFGHLFLQLGLTLAVLVLEVELTAVGLSSVFYHKVIGVSLIVWI